MHDRTILITGATGKTGARIAARLERSGVPVRRGERHAQQAERSLRAVAGTAYARIVADIARETLDGRNEATSPDVERILGRRPRSFREFARAAAVSGAWDTPLSRPVGEVQ